ncbi:ABC transporter permease [Salirhabdus salicampi]|uniref:ABC transporter permease n=1 Tax=Salirhabdus salicampi TaxID=476102 RepID=UPI0020C3F284|nr:ABC transporter permease subunit [Salirhabdus salicampi]MCP8615506.1 ABC transporter permease [Salirhabdus salicampi]
MTLPNLAETFRRFIQSPIWVIVKKEITDHIKSFRFNILIALILLTCIGSLYTALTSIRGVAESIDNNEELFLYLEIFSITGKDGTLPPFITFMSFLGPLLGISLGFDAVNQERNKGTLLRVMAQPIPRDYIILGKFLAALFVISTFIMSLGLLVIASGILLLGIPPTLEEFLRIFIFLLMTVIYISFWLSLSILLSIRFKQAATSALAGIAMWLFLSIFYSILVNLMIDASMPDQLFHQSMEKGNYEEMALSFMRLSPNYLYSEITTVLLTPNFRTLGPITMEQVIGAVPSPLGIGQSLSVIWPQLFGISALCFVCFALSYYIFIRQDVRS